MILAKHLNFSELQILQNIFKMINLRLYVYITLYAIKLFPHFSFSSHIYFLFPGFPQVFYQREKNPGNGLGNGPEKCAAEVRCVYGLVCCRGSYAVSHEMKPCETSCPLPDVVHTPRSCRETPSNLIPSKYKAPFG